MSNQVHVSKALQPEEGCQLQIETVPEHLCLWQRINILHTTEIDIVIVQATIMQGTKRAKQQVINTLIESM